MRHASAAAGVLCGSMLLVAACDTPIETEGFDSRPIAFSIVSGNGQTGAAGAELAEPLVVRVTRPAGNATVPVSRFLVNFRVMMGGGSIFAGSVLTDVNGIAQDYWTLGPTPGMNILEVRSVDPSTGEKH